MDLPQVRAQQHGREPTLLLLRRLAALTRRVIAAGALAALLLLLVTTAAAADPTPGPDAPRLTCAERFPAQGPAGVDLRLGCIVGEVAGLYTAASTEPPAPISTYALGLTALIAGALLVAWLATGLLARRAGRRMAPVVPASWWVCDRCRSVNGADAARCYSCGGPPSEGPVLPTSDRPEIPQSFGGRRD